METVRHEVKAAVTKLFNAVFLEQSRNLQLDLGPTSKEFYDTEDDIRRPAGNKAHPLHIVIKVRQWLTQVNQSSGQHVLLN